MTIKVERQTLINKLAGIKDDNVSIANVAINRAKLLLILKSLTQKNTEIVRIDYGQLGWEYKYEIHSDGTYKDKPYVKESEPCIQICCDHTVMRFFNRPKQGYNNVTAINFTDKVSTETIHGLAVDSRQLLNALTFVVPCMAVEDNRPLLHCVYFDATDESLKLVTADGYRLAVLDTGIKDFPTCLIDSTDIAKLITLLKSIKPNGKGKSKVYPQIYVSQTDDKIIFTYGLDILELNKVTGDFPKYARLIPEHGTHIEFIADDMLQAIKSLIKLANDSSGIVRLECSKDNIKISARSEEVGETSVECLAKVQTDCKFAMNGKYFMDFLKNTDKVVDMFVNSTTSPAVFYNGEFRQQVIMPMAVQW